MTIKFFTIAFLALGAPSIPLVRAAFDKDTSFIIPDWDKKNNEGENVGRPGPLLWSQSNATVGSKCYYNFADADPYRNAPENFVSRNGATKSDLDSMICAGQADPVVKEMDGDSGGPVLIKDASKPSGYLQVAVNGGSFAADEMWSEYVGFYVATHWKTVSPWLTKILAGDLAGAKAMTCASLGGPTLPNPNPRCMMGSCGRRRALLDVDNVGAVGSSRRRNLLLQGGKLTTPTDLPFMTTEGGIFGGGWNTGVLTGGSLTAVPSSDAMVFDNGCTGTLIAKNLILHAAHCDVPNAQELFWPGAWNASAIGEYDNYKKVVKFSERIIHPCYPAVGEWDTKPMEDISVVVLAKDVAGISPVSVALTEADTPNYPVDAYVAGWGHYCNTRLDDQSTCGPLPLKAYATHAAAAGTTSGAAPVAAMFATVTSCLMSAIM